MYDEKINSLTQVELIDLERVLYHTQICGIKNYSWYKNSLVFKNKLL